MFVSTSVKETPASINSFVGWDVVLFASAFYANWVPIWILPYVLYVIVTFLMKIDLPDSYVFRFVLVGNRSGLNGETSELQGIEKMNFEHPESPYILCKISSKNLLVRIQSKLLSYDARS